MKKRLLAILISFSVVTGSVYVPPGADAAAGIKLNKTKLNLTIGKTYKLKVKNFSGKVKWKSTKKKVAKVSKKGKVKAIKKGTAKIWAILPNKKLKCTVKVGPAKKITPASNNETSAPYITENPVSTNNSQNTQVPTENPVEPTNGPTEKPTEAPTNEPSNNDPTQAPTNEPTQAPTNRPTEKPTQAPTNKPTEKPTQAPTNKPTEKPTQAPTSEPTKDPMSGPTNEPDKNPTSAPTNQPTKDPNAAPTNEPTTAPTSAPTSTPTPEPTPVSTTRPVVIESGEYSYASDYTLGYTWGEIVAYKDSQKMSLADAGVTVYDNAGDRPFKAETEQAWDTKDLTLTQPVKYTTEDGVSHDIESMLTNFNFIADPAAIDNSDVDGKLYVYGTTEGIQYSTGNPDEDTVEVNGEQVLVPAGKMKPNQYKNHSLTILSTTDMVNWTDEGFMDTQNLTNEPSDSAGKVMGGFSSGQAWAPSGIKIDGDGDGEDEYYLFYTNGGATGYVMADSPTGPWRDPLGKALFDGSTPNCSDCAVCFDPAVLVDDKGDAYVYFGGLSVTSGRACKIKFEPGTGHVLRDGDPVKLPTYYMFEDNEINQFNGLYYYSYCSNWDGENQKLTNTASICVYVSSDPLNVSFDPTTRPAGQEKEAFTDENGVYRHFLGTVLDNPSSIYGQAYNNHHHMQSFKNHMYIFYHSTVLNNTIHRASRSYRNLHVDEITVDKSTDNISCTPSYEGADQIESFNPYVDFSGNIKEINATTTSYSAGVCSRRSDSRVKDGLSPMVLDEIDTGDWTKIQGVDFGTVGASAFIATVASETDNGAIEVYIDDPLSADNKVAAIRVNNTGNQDKFEAISTELKNPVTGVHDVYFVFRGTGYDVASWKFESNMEYISPFDAITGITSGDNEIEDYEIKYENGVYNIYITGENEEPGCQFEISTVTTVNGKKPIISYNEFTDYTKRMGTVYVDMDNYEYTYYMYYWCSANPKPAPTPKPATPVPPTPTPVPTPTPKPTPPPEMLDHYSAPYTLVFGNDTVATQGSSSYKLNDDGTVTIQVSGQYSGIAFVLPKGLEENNFDTVTITYKDARDVGDGYGCGLWRTGDNKDSEDVVAWSGLFKDASGEYKASIAGRENTKAWYVNKCLLFNNTGGDALSAAPATVTITSVVFSHSKYGQSVETPKPTAAPKPTATPKPFEDIVINPSDFSDSDFVSKYVSFEKEVKIEDSAEGGSSVTIPPFGCIIIKNPSDNVGKYKYVQITYSSDDSVQFYMFDNEFTDGMGAGASGQHQMDDLAPSSVYNTVTYSADNNFTGGCISAIKLFNFEYGEKSRTVKIKSVKFLAEAPEQSLADKATIVKDIPSDFNKMKDDVEYGEFKNISYYSDITNSNRSANVVLPPGYDESKEYPVVYMLHGIGCSKEMFGTDIQGSSIARIFGNLRAEGKCEDMIIVFPDIHVSDLPDGGNQTNENYKHYDDFREELINNLMPCMEKNFSVKTGRENTGICGWSMGGREALYIGLSKPEMFGYVGGYCPAFGLLPYTNPAFGTSEDGLLTVEGAKEDIILLPDEYINNTFVQIGRGIYDDLVGQEPVRYHNALTTGGVPHIYTEYYSGHSDGVYDPGFYNFILNAFKLIKTDEGGDDTPDVTKPPVTPKPSGDIVINPSDFDNSDCVYSDGKVQIDTSADGYGTVTISPFAGVIIKNPSDDVSKYKYVQITYSCDSAVQAYMFDYKFTDGIGEDTPGQHQMDDLEPSEVYNTVTYSTDNRFAGEGIAAVKLFNYEYGDKSRTVKIKSIKFLTEPPVTDNATIVKDVPSDFKEMKEGVEYGEIKNISYYSDITKSNRSANVLLPPGYDKSEEYPVVYMLHGIGLSKEMYGTNIEGCSIARIFGNLRAEGKCEDMIIVFPDIHVSDLPDGGDQTNENYKHYDDFREELINNLMPCMEKNFSVKTGRENTGICGWSMGGREALYIGLSKPEMFGYVGGYCPAFGLLPYTNPDFETSEDGLLTVEGAKEDIILLPDEYINNTFVQIGRGMWDDLVKEEPARYHNALTNGGVPHIYTEYNAPHNEGVWEPGFYSFILNAFKLIKTDENFHVGISKDNEYNNIYASNVVYEEDGISFKAGHDAGGGGMAFWAAGEGKPINLSNYAKMVVELTAEDASVPIQLGMYKSNPPDVWGNTMSLSDAWFNTSDTAGGRTVFEYDLNKIEGEDREGDLYGIGIRVRGWESKNYYNIKIHSITFIPSEPMPELTSLKSVVEPVFGHIGTCINSWQLKQLKTIKYVAENYTSISLENEMKPDAILRGPISTDDARENTVDYVIPDNYTEETVPKLNFETVDEVLRIAKKQGLKIRAHTLVWHGQTPEFFFREGYNEKAAYVDEKTMNARLEMFIRSVMHHIYTLDDGAYKDVVYTWDVANEYMHNDADANWSAVYGNRSTKLKNKPGYIKLAFQIAHDCLEEYGIADKVTLVYNDFNTYFDCRENIIEMINYFNAEEKICDGVGMQSHLGVGFPSVEGYLYTLEEFVKAGFDVQITELDIGTDNKTYEVQAEYVRQLMEGLIDIQERTHKIKGITWWGLCDTSSWRGDSDPLMFGKTMYDAKPAYYSFINAFNKE